MTVPKTWKIKQADDLIAGEIEKALKIHPAICRLLALRGISGYDSAKFFFRPSIKDLHDPYLMKGMDVAVKRILSALNNGEKIRI